MSVEVAWETLLGVECRVIKYLVTQVGKVTPSPPPSGAHKVLGLIDIPVAALVLIYAVTFNAIQFGLLLHYPLYYLPLFPRLKPPAVAPTHSFPHHSTHPSTFRRDLLTH